MKKLNPKAFWPLLCGIGAGAVMLIVNIVMSLTVGGGLQAAIDEAMATSGQELTEDMIVAVESFVKVFLVIIFLIVLSVYAYFIFRVLKNRKEKTSQTYITVLLVLNSIGLLFNLLSIPDPVSILSAIVNASIITGCVMQKRYVEPIVYEDDELLPPNEFTPRKDDDIFPGHSNNNNDDVFPEH